MIHLEDGIFFFILFLLLNYSVFSNDKIEINADQFTSDKDNTRIYATGNVVEIIDSEFKLLAEAVTSQKFSRKRNVKYLILTKLKIPTGKKIVDQNLNNAIIEDNYLCSFR